MHTLYFLVSHNRDEVYRLCKKLAVLHHGKVEVTGAKKRNFSKSSDCLCCCLNRVWKYCGVCCERADVILWRVEFKEKRSGFWKVKGAFLGIRACDIKVEKTKEHADIRCTVESVIESVADWIYFLRPVGAVRTLRMEISKIRCRFTKKDMRYSFPFRERRFCFWDSFSVQVFLKEKSCCRSACLV